MKKAAKIPDPKFCNLEKLSRKAGYNARFAIPFHLSSPNWKCLVEGYIVFYFVFEIKVKEIA